MDISGRRKKTKHEEKPESILVNKMPYNNLKNVKVCRFSDTVKALSWNRRKTIYSKENQRTPQKILRNTRSAAKTRPLLGYFASCLLASFFVFFFYFSLFCFMFFSDVFSLAFLLLVLFSQRSLIKGF